MADELQEALNPILQETRDGWPGAYGEDLARRLDEYIRAKVAHYSEVFGYEPLAILEAMEERRNYSAVNYYQEANFPAIDDSIKVYDSFEEMRRAIPTDEFRCPSCKGVSSDPHTCTLEDCDWKSYGLFRTGRKGLRFTLRDKFLKSGAFIEEIFMPLALEKS